MKTIQEVLHFENILKVIQEVKGGVTGGILPEEMFRPTQKGIGNVGYYFKVTSTRKVAQAVRYGSPSKNVKLPGVAKVPVTLTHSFEHFDHEPNLVAILKSPDDRIQQLGAAEVGRQAGEFTRRFVNSRRAYAYSALTTGKIMLDDEGELTMKAGDAVITIDFGVPASNKNQLNSLGKGNIIATKWSDSAADMAGQIANLQIASASLTGYPVTTAYYGKKIPTYVAKNTIMKEFLKMNPGYAADVASGAIPDGFISLRWRPSYTANYVNPKGSVELFWGDNMVVFTPDVTDVGWWDFIEGSYAIPSNVGQLYGDASQAINSLQTIFGLFGYAIVNHDPAGIRQYGGDTSLPVIAVPKAVFVADVEF